MGRYILIITFESGNIYRRVVDDASEAWRLVRYYEKNSEKVRRIMLIDGYSERLVYARGFSP